MNMNRESSFRLPENSVLQSYMQRDDGLGRDMYENYTASIQYIAADYDLEEPEVSLPFLSGDRLARVFSQAEKWVSKDNPSKYTMEEKLSFYGLWK